jgi:hypothetical protein
MRVAWSESAGRSRQSPLPAEHAPWVKSVPAGRRGFTTPVAALNKLLLSNLGVANRMADQATQVKLEELNLPDGIRIIAKEPGKYTIYETPDHRVAIDGPDRDKCNDPGIHKAMGEIADITIHNPKLKSKYNSRIGYAYKIALDGNPGGCEVELHNIAQDMTARMRRECQQAYQIGALGATVLPAIVYLIAFQFSPLNDLAIRLFSAAVFAALGGFLSVLIGSHQLELDLKESFGATMVYGVFRIIIGIISGVVVVFLIRADFLLGPLKKPGNYDAFAVACFVAGFSERLIPNVLKNFESSTRAHESNARSQK